MKSKKQSLLRKALILIVLFLFLGMLLWILIATEKKEFDEKNSKISYIPHRAPPEYSINKINETSQFQIFKIIYTSEEFMNTKTEIHGLLYLPLNRTNPVPGIVFLPGGGVKKEDEPAAKEIASLGYAVLVIDQRGIGETSGIYPNYDQDKLIFEKRKESIQHLGVYDALRGLDVLKNLEEIDKENLLIGGSSMGGRYAMIAAAIDPSIKKAIIISSAGFHIESTKFGTDPYFLSIDPDRYVKDISPNKLVMFHSTKDSIIKIDDAKYTFSLAEAPKTFYTIETCEHGYCRDMLPYLERELLISK